MDRLIWTAVTGMNASMARQRMIASNMANAQTIGFRAEVMRVTPITLQGPSLEARAMTDAEVHGAIMSPGSITQTGRPLDVAMQGDAMLTVQAMGTGADGSEEEAYTRRGDLSISPNGLLVNGEGYPLVGENGPISLPLGSDVSIGPDGAVLVRDKANPDAPPQQVEKLKLANWRGTAVLKGLDGLFRVEQGGVLPRDESARVLSGALEQSNVKPSEVMVEMVEAQRLYDMRTKLIATAKELDEGGASLMRMS